MNEEVIVSTKDRLGSYDAIETAKPGEPLFPIQGGDPFGPPTVLHWARLAREAGMAEQDEKRADKLLTKASEAEQVAWAMERYQSGELAVEGKRTNYTDAVILDDDTDHERAVRVARIKGAEGLHNIVGLGSALTDQLAGLGACPAEVAELRDAIETIRCIAGEVEPRRGNERS